MAAEHKQLFAYIYGGAAMAAKRGQGTACGAPAPIPPLPLGEALRFPPLTEGGCWSESSKSPTKRQRDTLDFIRAFVDENGFPPTVRDICLGLGLSSTQTVHAHLHKLEEKGFIRLGNTHRSLQLVARPGQRLSELIPLAGRVAAGVPLLATENVEGYLNLGAGLAGEIGDRFALKVRGESMVEAGIVDGDYIVVRLQQTAENGDIVVALIGDEATVKFFFREEDRIRLQPANSSMQPLYLKDVAIIGKVLASFRAYEPGSFLQATDA